MCCKKCSGPRAVFIVSAPDPLTYTRSKKGLVTFDGFSGLTGYVNCVQLPKSHVLKRCRLISMHALVYFMYNIRDHGTGTSRYFKGHLESHDFSNPSVLIGLPEI